MASKHYHYGNGSAGCLYDTQEICTTRKAAIKTAELIFGDSLCDVCYRDMSRALRSHAAKDGVTFYFDTTCANKTPDGGTCFAGADLVSISVERGSIRENQYGELSCNC